MGKWIRMAALLLVVTAPSAWAAETEYDFTYCIHSERNVVESNAEITTFTADSFGIAMPTNTFKPWENATAHCVNYTRITGGKATVKGTCRWVDSSGDVFIGEFDSLPDKPSLWTFITGTGKWRGISGTGTFKLLNTGKPAAEGTSQACLRATGKYTLPWLLVLRGASAATLAHRGGHRI